MRIAMFMQWDGFKPQQYEELRKTVNWEGNTPDGAVFHMAAFTTTGIKVSDIWESEKDFNDFLQNRLMPGVKMAGIIGDPRVEIYPLQTIYAPAFEEEKKMH